MDMDRPICVPITYITLELLVNIPITEKCTKMTHARV